MSDNPERRDIQGTLTTIQVDIATIKERTLAQGKTLEEVKGKLDGSVSRGEFETRYDEVEAEVKAATKIVNEVRDDSLRRQGAERVWRFVFSAALAILGSLEALLHR